MKICRRTVRGAFSWSEGSGAAVDSGAKNEIIKLQLLKS